MHYNDICAADAFKMFKQQNVTILDMRDIESYDRAHISGAYLVTDQVLRSLSRPDKRDNTLLIYCYHGENSRDLANYFVKLGVSNVFNLEGGWQAWSAFILGKIPAELSTWLTENNYSGINLNETNEHDLRPLMTAAKQGNRYITDKLIEFGALVNARNADGNTALWFACTSNEIKIINLLIQNNANVNINNIYGTTPLIYAASTGMLDVVLALVEAGADLFRQTTEGFNALELAASIDVLKFLKPLYQLEHQNFH